VSAPAVTVGDHAATRYPCELDVAGDLWKATYVLGTQGSGKSTLLGHLAEQFAGAGEGVLLIDTKGELAEDLAARTRHADRLVFVAPGRCFFPAGPRYWALNLFDFDRAKPYLGEIAVYNLLSLFERMGLAKLDTMPQVVQMLEAATRLALVRDGSSFADLLRIMQVGHPLRRHLVEEGRRSGRLSAIAEAFWEEFEERTPAQQREATRTTVARVNRLLAPAVIGKLLTPARSTLRLAEWLDAGKLVVCDLGTNLGIGAQGVPRLLGNLLVAQLINLTFARPIGRGRVWRVIVDEFHELAGDQFAELITQGRKFRVFPVIAHQNLAQLGDELTNAVTQCPWRFFLRVSAEDRPVIRRLFGEETAAGLERQENYTARVHFAEGPTGFFHQEPLRLCDWWAERDPAQLAAARAAAANPRYTLPDAPAPVHTARQDTAIVAPSPPAPAETPDAAPQPGEVSDEPPRPLRDAFPAAPAARAADQPRPRPARRRVAAQAPAAGGGGAPRARPARLLDQWPGE